MAEATLTETLAKQAEEALKEETVKKSLADKFPCPEGDIFSLPTRADITNAFNEIASIPGELAAQVQGNKAAREKEIAELTALLENPDLTEEERQAILDEIETMGYGVTKLSQKILNKIQFIHCFLLLAVLYNIYSVAKRLFVQPRYRR